MLTKLWRSFTETPNQRRERKRRKREARNTDSSSISSSDSERDEPGPDSIIVGGRTLRRTAERTARAANQQLPQTAARSRTSQQPHTHTGRENSEPQDIEDYFTSDSSISDNENEVSNASTSAHNNSPATTVTPSSTASAQSDGSLELVRVRPIRQTDRAAYILSSHVPVSQVPRKSVYPALHMNPHCETVDLNITPTSDSRVKVSKKSSSEKKPYSNNRPMPSAPFPDHDPFEEVPPDYDLFDHEGESPERFAVSPYKDSETTSNSDEFEENQSHQLMPFPSNNSAHHTKQVIFTGNPSHTLPQIRPSQKARRQKTTPENRGTRECCIPGQSIPVPSTNPAPPHMPTGGTHNHLRSKHESSCIADEFNQELENEFLSFMDPLRKLLIKNASSSSDYRIRNTAGEPGDPHDSPSSSSEESDVDDERHGNRRNGDNHKKKNGGGNKKKSKDKRNSGGKDKDNSDAEDKHTRKDKKTRRKKKRSNGGDGGDSSPDDSSDGDTNSGGSSDDEDSGDDARARRTKKKRGESIQTINIVGMHGNTPNLEPFYNSVQDKITFLELIDSFEVQCLGLHIDESRWARLLATYLRHSALLEYQDLIKQKPKCAENYKRLKAGLIKRFSTRTGVINSTELFNKTKGSDTVGKFYTQVVSLSKQTFPDLDEPALNEIIKAQFIRGLDSRTRRSIMNRGNLSLHEVFKMAERLESTNAIMDNNNDKIIHKKSTDIHAVTDDGDRLMHSLVKQVKDIHDKVGAGARNQNFNPRPENQDWRKQPPLENTPRQRPQPYNNYNQPSFDRFGNPRRNQYNPPPRQNYNQYQRHYQNPTERTQFRNYNQYRPPPQPNQAWRGYSRDNNFGRPNHHTPESRIRDYAQNSRGSPPNEVTFAGAQKCSRCGRLGHNSYSCRINTEQRDAYMMRNYNRNPRIKDRYRNKHRKGNNEKQPNFWPQLVPRRKIHIRDSHNRLIPLVDMEPANKEVCQDTHDKLTSNHGEQSTNSLGQEPPTLDQNVTTIETSPVFPKSDMKLNQMSGEDKPHLAMVKPFRQNNNVGNDDNATECPKIQTTPIKQEFDYTLSCDNITAGKTWTIGQTQKLGNAYRSVGVHHKYMSSTERLLPFTHLEAEALFSAIKYWEPWYRMVGATVTCKTTSREGTAKLKHMIWNDMKSILITNEKSSSLSDHGELSIKFCRELNRGTTSNQGHRGTRYQSPFPHEFQLPNPKDKTFKYLFGARVIIFMMMALFNRADASGYSLSSQPMLCNHKLGHDSRSLMMKLEQPKKCPEYQESNSAIQNINMTFYQQRPLLEQEIGYLCYHKTTVTASFLYFFADERIYHQTETFKPVSPEICRQMIHRDGNIGSKLKDKNGIISTHNSIEPKYHWCCRWFNHTVENYVLERGYLYLNRKTKKVETSLGNTHGCKYENGICRVADYGTIMWEPITNQTCFYTIWQTKPGEYWNENWLSNDKTMALSFSEHGLDTFKLCSEDNNGITIHAFRSDQGYYVSNTSEIINATKGWDFERAVMPSDATFKTRGVFSAMNSIGESLAISIFKNSLKTFWSSIHYLCEHEQTAIQVFGAVINSSPTITMRKLLNDSYITARMLTEQIVAIESCVQLEDYNLIGLANGRCYDKVPITIDWGGMKNNVYLDPRSNIIHKTTSEIQCSPSKTTILSVNGQNYEYHWAEGEYKKIGNITEIHTKAFHPSIHFQPMPLNIYKEDAIPIPIPDVYSNGDIVNDLLHSIAQERQQMRRIGLWPSSGSISGTSKNIKGPHKLNLLDFLKSGWHRIFQIWTLTINILVSCFIILICCQCSGNFIKQAVNNQTSSRISMLSATPLAKQGETTRSGNSTTNEEITECNVDNTPFWCPLVKADIFNPENLFDENNNLVCVDIPIMIDTGACHNLISYYVAEQLGLRINKTEHRPHSITNHALPIEGETELIIKIGDTISTQKFLVGKNGVVLEMLIGFRFTWCLEYISFDIKGGYVDLGGDIVPMIPCNPYNQVKSLSPNGSPTTKNNPSPDEPSDKQNEDHLEYPNLHTCVLF